MVQNVQKESTGWTVVEAYGDLGPSIRSYKRFYGLIV